MAGVPSRTLTRLLSSTPHSPAAYLHRALARGGKGDADGAKNDRAKALSLNHGLASVYAKDAAGKSTGFEGVVWEPDRTLKAFTFPAEAYLTRGEVLLERGDCDGALRNFQEVLAIDPDNLVGRFDLGKTLCEMWRLPEALDAFEQVLKMEGDWGTIWLGKGLVLVAMGKEDEAKSCVDKGLQLAEAYIKNYTKDEKQQRKFVDSEKKKYETKAESIRKKRDGK